MSVAESAEQCHAITADGDRCSHPAREDGFCHQHDESDPTVDEQSDGDEQSAGDEQSDGGGESDEERESEDESGTDGGAGDDDHIGDVLQVRETVHSVAERLIGQELDGVVEVTRNGDDWLATVEVVERQAVPDTQDILGKYEVSLDSTGTVTGYRRVATYRRGDTSREDIAP